MAEVKKITKRERFEELRAIVEELSVEQRADKEEILEFIDKQIEALDTKAEKAKERAAKAKAKGDELRGKVEAVLTDKAQTIDQIVEKLGEADVTRAQVVSRLTQLVQAEKADREEVKDGSRKVKAYRLSVAAETPSESFELDEE